MVKVVKINDKEKIKRLSYNMENKLKILIPEIGTQ